MYEHESIEFPSGGILGRGHRALQSLFHIGPPTGRFFCAPMSTAAPARAASARKSTLRDPITAAPPCPGNSLAY